MKLPYAVEGRRVRGRFWRKNKEFTWGHVKFEISVKHPRRVVE